MFQLQDIPVALQAYLSNVLNAQLVVHPEMVWNESLESIGVKVRFVCNHHSPRHGQQHQDQKCADANCPCVSDTPNTWTSHHCRLFMLYHDNQVSLWISQQSCKHCQVPYEEPWIDEHELAKKLDWLVDRDGSTGWQNSGKPRPPQTPHLEEFCELCDRGICRYGRRDNGDGGGGGGGRGGGGGGRGRGRGSDGGGAPRTRRPPQHTQSYQQRQQQQQQRQQMYQQQYQQQQHFMAQQQQQQQEPQFGARGGAFNALMTDDDDEYAEDFQPHYQQQQGRQRQAPAPRPRNDLDGLRRAPRPLVGITSVTDDHGVERFYSNKAPAPAPPQRRTMNVDEARVYALHKLMAAPNNRLPSGSIGGAIGMSPHQLARTFPDVFEIQGRFMVLLPPPPNGQPQQQQQQQQQPAQPRQRRQRQRSQPRTAPAPAAALPNVVPPNPLALAGAYEIMRQRIALAGQMSVPALGGMLRMSPLLVMQAYPNEFIRLPTGMIALRPPPPPPRPPANPLQFL